MTPTQLFHAHEKGKTCISLIISLQHILTGKDQVSKAIDKTGMLLEGMITLIEKEKVTKGLKQLSENISVPQMEAFT
jgi:hypothetical protein